jgi:tetratricopeptide (TPR) repeat protein
MLKAVQKALRQRQANNARTILQQTYQREPNMTCPTGLATRVRLALMLGLVREGQKDVASLRKLQPNDPNVRETEAAFAQRAGKTQDALNILSEIIQKHPDRYTAYASRAKIHERAEDLPRALEDYNQAAATAPERMRFNFLHPRSHLLTQMSRHEEALKDAEACSQLSPKNMHFILMKGECLKALNRDKEAKSAFEAVLAAPGAAPADQDKARANLKELKGQ